MLKEIFPNDSHSACNQTPNGGGNNDRQELNQNFVILGIGKVQCPFRSRENKKLNCYIFFTPSELLEHILLKHQDMIDWKILDNYICEANEKVKQYDNKRIILGFLQKNIVNINKILNNK